MLIYFSYVIRQSKAEVRRTNGVAPQIKFMRGKLKVSNLITLQQMAALVRYKLEKNL
jgi:hypothetical protein